MTSSTRSFLAPAVAVAAAAALFGALTAAPSYAAGDTTTIRIGQLERGAGPAVPVALGTVILHGERSIEVDARELDLLGTSGDDYVAVVHDADGARVERITPDGARTALTARIKGQLELSQDGGHLYEAIVRGRRDAVVRVRDTATGDLEHKRRFDAPVTVAGADADVAIVSTTRPDASYRWDLVEPDVLIRMARRAAYDAEVRADRYVIGQGDGGETFCSQVRSISSPRHTTWATCDHTVLEIQPDSRRLLAGPSYLDGPLGSVTLRAPRGHRLVGLQLPRRATFGAITWEDGDHVLAEVLTRRHVSFVRCDTGGGCERASDIEDTPYSG